MPDPLHSELGTRHSELRLVMMGTGTFAEPTFDTLLAGPDPVVGLVTQPDREKGVKSGSTRQTGRGMKQIAEEHGLPVLQPERMNAPEAVEALQALKPDLLVVAAYGQILSKTVLSVPTMGGINVHGSLLPKYRGAAPIAWAIYHGETEAGVTIIRMSAKLDAGEMLAKDSLPIGPDETAGELEARLAPLGARLAQTVIDRMRVGPVSGEKQDPALVTQAPKLTKAHGLIDWTRPAELVCRQIRAMQPWPSAYTFWHRTGVARPVRLQISRASVMWVDEAGRTPGELLVMSESHRLLVAAGDGQWVEVRELQPEGKKRMPAEAYLRGHPAYPGDRLGAESA